MPQARTAGSSPANPSAPKSRSARTAAGKPASTRSAAAKAAAAKRAAAKPAAAKSAAAKRTAAKPAATRSAAAKPAAKTAAAKPAAKAATAKSAGRTKTTAARPAAVKTAARKNGATAKSSPRVTIRVNAENVQVEAIAERLRKLNERIIEFGREAGESTLTSYEKALKAIANGVSQSPAKDELEWITQLAASQAKFVRDITDSWAKAARERLK